MNIFQVSYKNLLRRRLRTVFTIIGIALSTWVLVTLLGFNQGYEKSLNRDIEGMGFQMALTAKGCPYEAATLMMKGGTGLKYLSEELVENVSNSSEVLKATKMLMHAEFDPFKGESGGMAVYMGVEPEPFFQMKPYFKFIQGGEFSSDTANEVVLGYEIAELEQREQGDLMLLPGTDEEFIVSGILERTGTQDDGTIFVPIKTIQRIFDKEGLITMLGIALDKDINVKLFEDKLYELPDVQVVSMAQVRNTIMSLVSSAKAIVMSIAFIAFLIAMFGVLNTVLMSVFERYQEIGILKSIGALPRHIFIMIWTETTLLCATGGIIGILFSFIFSSFSEIAIRYFIPFAPNGSLIVIDSNIVLFSFVAITMTGILGGIFPSLKAARIRPLDAIRSE